MSNAPTMTLKTSAEKLAKKLYEVEELAREALESRPGAVGEDWAYLMNALADVQKICSDPFGEYRTPKEVLETVAGERPLDAMLANPPFDIKRTTASARETFTVERKDWLELPRNITLKRFSNSKRETHFIGQYTDANPAGGNPNPRRVYTIDVVPLGTEDLAAVGIPPVFEVSGRVDGHQLFKIVTRHGRAVAEYLGVKALKAWRNYSGSRRRGKQSLKNHHKRYRANKRARKAAAKEMEG